MKPIGRWSSYTDVLWGEFEPFTAMYRWNNLEFILVRLDNFDTTNPALMGMK